MSRILCAIAAALTLALVAPTAAEAGRWSDIDEAGDVAGYTWSPDPEPCGTESEIDGSAQTNIDITRLSVRHTRSAVVVTTGFRALKKGHEQFEMMYLRTELGGWWLDADRFKTRRGFRTWASLMVEPDLPHPDDIESECGVIAIVVDEKRCRVARDFDFERDRITIEVPRECLGNPRWVRVGASAYEFVDPDPETPGDTSFHDHWDRGTVLSPWAPPFGPRVRAQRGARVGSARSEAVSPDVLRHALVTRHGILARR